MNVSKLSKVQLNRAMIWLYPPKHREFSPFNDDGEICSSGFLYDEYMEYDYLTDYNLLMPLAVENKLKINFLTKEVSAMGHYPYSKNKNPLRAICEVLVMIALEKIEVKV